MVFDIRNLKQVYNDKSAVDVPQLTLQEKSITGLFGPNGAGKTTLLSLLALIRKPTSGTLLYRGTPATPFSDGARSRITLLSQDPYLLKRTVFHNVAYGLKIRRDTTDIRRRVSSALESVGLAPEEFSYRRWDQLSGGEARRVALAARLVIRPDILLLDEPTANIDAESTLLIRKAVLRAREDHGTTLIIASHDREWLYDISDSVLHMYNGKILSGKMISLIFGPWEPSDRMPFWKKTGTDLLVPKPDSPKAVSVFSAGLITIRPKNAPIPNGYYSFDACLTAVSTDSTSESRYGTLKTEGLTLTGILDILPDKERLLSPGEIVSAVYKPEDVPFIN